MSRETGIILMQVVIILFMFLCSIVAKRKGYNPFIWFFAGGPLGVAVLIFLRNINKITDQIEAQKTGRWGNIIGIIIILIPICLMIKRFSILLNNI